MAICYKCKGEITTTNKSIEHIIPNALGGRLKSANLLCRPCNEKLGSSVDIALSQKIPFALLLNVKRDNGDNYKILGRDEHNKEFYIQRNPNTGALEAEQKPEKPQERTLENGKKAKKFIGIKTITQYLESLKKKKPFLDIEEELAKVNWEQERGERNFTFYEEQLKGDLANRALSKIGLEYFLHKGGGALFVEDLIQIVFGNTQIVNGEIGAYYFQHRKDSIISLGANEVSHTLYLKGNHESKTLFCYIDLFSIYKYVIFFIDRI